MSALTRAETRSGEAYVLEPSETDTILAALRLWQGDSGFGRITDELRNIATNCGVHEELDDKAIDALCEYLNCGPAEAEPKKPVELSECCHATIGYDAWADSNEEICGGPFDNASCMNCGMDDPEAWDGTSPPWPRSKREGGADLPEGVEEPPVRVLSIELRRQQRGKNRKWLIYTICDDGSEKSTPTGYPVTTPAEQVARVAAGLHPTAKVGVYARELTDAAVTPKADTIVWFDRAKLMQAI